MSDVEKKEVVLMSGNKSITVKFTSSEECDFSKAIEQVILAHITSR